MTLSSYFERLEYLKTHGKNPGNQDRHLMNIFYKSDRWLYVRSEVLKRDLGCDLGVDFMEIKGIIVVHHINPITEDDILHNAECLYDMDNLVCCSIETHNKIHYDTQPKEDYTEREPGDTRLW